MAARRGDDQCPADERQGNDLGSPGRLLRELRRLAAAVRQCAGERGRGRVHRRVLSGRARARGEPGSGSCRAERLPLLDGGAGGGRRTGGVEGRPHRPRVALPGRPEPGERRLLAKSRSRCDRGCECLQCRERLPSDLQPCRVERDAGAALARAQAARRDRHARHRHADARADRERHRMGRRAGDVLQSMPGVARRRSAGSSGAACVHPAIVAARGRVGGASEGAIAQPLAH